MPARRRDGAVIVPAPPGSIGASGVGLVLDGNDQHRLAGPVEPLELLVQRRVGQADHGRVVAASCADLR